MDIKECLPNGVGLCRNEAMIEDLQADNAMLKERNAELMHDVAWLFNHRATLVRFVRELRAANDDLVAVNETEIAELRQLIDAADAEWRRFVALTHDEQITDLEQRWQQAEEENARLREALEAAPVNHFHNCYTHLDEQGNAVLGECHHDCWERMRHQALRAQP